MTRLRAILLIASAGALAACQGSGPTVPDEGSAPAAPSPQAAPAPTPEAAPAPGGAVLGPAVPAGPASPAMQQQAQRIALSAVTMLEAGEEDAAKAELQRALAADPNNKLALNLVRQVGADPVAALGRESFSYTVRPNESLSMIAGRFLGDIYSFYILARYNGIAVPRQVAGGQTLRIPGKAPPATAREAAPAPLGRETHRPEPVVAPAAAPAPAAAAEPGAAERAMRAGEAAERGGDLERAFAEYRRAASLAESGADARVDRVRRQLVQRYSLTARTAFARQDLDGAIHAWDRVLGVDPANDTARLERQRAMTLKDKAGKL